MTEYLRPQDRLFYVQGLDDPDFTDEPAPSPAVVDHWTGAGQQYIVRMIDDVRHFRSAHFDSEDWTCFLICNAETTAEMDEVKFEELLMSGSFGRFVVYRILCQHGSHDICHLWLSPDGAGRALHDESRYEFRWDPAWASANIHAIGVPELIVLCDLIFKECLNPILLDPYIDGDPKNESISIEFICGSEDELRRVSRWILQSDPDIFRKNQTRSITYVAAIPDGGSMGIAAADLEIERTSGPCFQKSEYADRILKLSELAFEYNSFTGLYWEYQDMSANRRSGWEAHPLEIVAEAERPSAHEQAEALLSLADWLKEKAPEAERRALLVTGR